MIKINSGYAEHIDAIDEVKSIGIDLNVINTDSPYKLASTNNPDIVISRNSKIINNEYPAIKFIGPECKFPNYDVNIEFGVDIRKIFTYNKFTPESKIVLINRNNNNEFINTVLSKFNYVRVFGNKIDYYGYTGQILNDVYGYLLSSEISAVDNEFDALKSLACGIKTVLTPFDYPYCTNLFSDKYCNNLVGINEFITSKTWTNIFKKLLESVE